PTPSPPSTAPTNTGVSDRWPAACADSTTGCRTDAAPSIRGRGRGARRTHGPAPARLPPREWDRRDGDAAGPVAGGRPRAGRFTARARRPARARRRVFAVRRAL